MILYRYNLYQWIYDISYSLFLEHLIQYQSIRKLEGGSHFYFELLNRFDLLWSITLVFTCAFPELAILISLVILRSKGCNILFINLNFTSEFIILFNEFAFIEIHKIKLKVSERDPVSHQRKLMKNLKKIMIKFVDKFEFCHFSCVKWRLKL